MKKKIVFLDMDGVLADFDVMIKSGVDNDPPEMFEPGFFRTLPVIKGSKKAVATLLANPNLDVYIGSKVTSKNTLCATEKMEWVKEHFPKLLRRMVLVCDKKLLRGDYLIDDDYERWAKKFKGKFLHFKQSNPIASWKRVLKEFK